MSDTDLTVLEQYKLARDAILVNLAAGTKEVVELEIRNRRVEYSSTNQSLEMIEKLIKFYERKTTSGASRNYAKLKR